MVLGVPRFPLAAWEVPLAYLVPIPYISALVPLVDPYAIPSFPPERHLLIGGEWKVTGLPASFTPLP